MNHIIEEVAAATSLPQTAVTQENNQTESQSSNVNAEDWELLSKEEAAALKQPLLPQGVISQAQTVEKPKIQTGMVPVALLRPYAKNAEIYRQRENPLLRESIDTHGVRTALLADEEGVVYGGTTRLRYAIETGKTEVPVKVISFKTEDDKLLLLVDDNLGREKTNEEKTREYMARKAIEGRKAALRRAEAGKKHGKQAEEVKTLAPLPDKKGKSRDLAAEGSGRTGASLEKGSKVVEAADKLREEGDAKTANELFAKLDKDGYEPAFKLAQSLELIPKPKPEVKAGAPTKAKADPAETVTAPKADGEKTVANKIASSAGAPPIVDAKSVKAPAIGKDTLPALEAGDTPAAAETSDQPVAVELIVGCLRKASHKLKDLDIGELTLDQRGNLDRELECLAVWRDDHSLMLKVPARS